MSQSQNRMLDFVRGLVAAAMIVFILVGVPWLLMNVVGMPFGSMFSDLTDPLTSQSIKAAAALRLGLSIIVWAAWLQVAWAFLIELLAAVQGRAASPAPLVLPSFQRSARQIVAAAMLVITVFSSPAGAAPLTPLGSAGAVAAELTETGNSENLMDGSSTAMFPSASSGEMSESGATIEYRVQSGDSFWSLAEHRLGDGFRWREIRQMNEGRVVGDGLAITNQTENLQPGWTLAVPSTASETVDGTASEATQNVMSDGENDTLAVTTVDRGDHFWALAKEKLSGEWGRQPTDDELRPYWADMVALNQDQLLPPGDPDLIYPGQQLHFPPIPVVDGITDNADNAVPADNADDAVPADNADDAVPAPADADAVVDDLPSTTTSTPIQRDIQSSSVDVSPAADADTDVSGDDNSQHDSSDNDASMSIGLVAVTGIGLVTAAVGGVIARNQAHRLGTRRPGTTPGFELPAIAQDLITETSDPEALDDLDTALRHLGAELAAADLALPGLVGTLVEQDSIRLLLATPHNAAPNPFKVERGGMVWIAPRPYPSVDVRRAQNPYPLLVAVGHTNNAQLLIDLEYVGAVSLDGGFADVVDLMGTMALQLATSPMADTIEVMCVGFAEELAELERVTVVPNLEAGLSRVSGRADEVNVLVQASENSGPAGRSAGIGDWTPLVVFDPLSELSDGTAELIAAALRSKAAGVAAVVTTVEGTSLTMELTEDRVSIPAYGVNLDRRALTRTERNALSTAVDRVKKPTDKPSTNLIELLSNGQAADGDRVSPPFSEAAATTPMARPVMVRLLGPLRVEDHNGGLLQFARSATPEFIAYLIHHRGGIEVGRVMNTLWPSTTARRSWIANVHADAGRTLAAVGEGVTVTPNPGADDEYHLSEEIGSDLELLQLLVSSAVSLPLDEALSQLTEALQLVEGIPYSNIISRWPMSEGHWQEATVLVDEAARCVATLALDHFDDPALAEWATAKGLLASPQSVELHRLRLRAAIALDGGDIGVERAGTRAPAPLQPTAMNPDAAATSGNGSGAGVGIGLSPDAVFQHYQAVAMADDHRPEGGSQLDHQLLELYESYRRSRLAPSGRSTNDAETSDWR